MYGHIYFEIHATDTERAIKFYGEAFGWKFTKIPYAPVEYWHIETGGTMGGLLQRPLEAPSAECGANAFVCSIEVPDFDAMAQKIEQLGGTVVLPKFPVPATCWHGYFRDSEGNTFGIFEVDEKAA